MTNERKKMLHSLRTALLIEAGYKCANPTCPQMLFEMHHLDPLATGGKDNVDNLIALCPNCHTRHHSGFIPEEALRTWKVALVSLNAQLTKEAINSLLCLFSLEKIMGTSQAETHGLLISGDGVLRLAGFLNLGMVEVNMIGVSYGMSQGAALFQRPFEKSVSG